MINNVVHCRLAEEENTKFLFNCNNKKPFECLAATTIM